MRVNFHLSQDWQLSFFFLKGTGSAIVFLKQGGRETEDNSTCTHFIRNCMGNYGFVFLWKRIKSWSGWSCLVPSSAKVISSSSLDDLKAQDNYQLWQSLSDLTVFLSNMKHTNISVLGYTDDFIHTDELIKVPAVRISYIMGQHSKMLSTARAT